MGWIVRHDFGDMEDNKKKKFYTYKSRKFIKTEKVYNTNHANTVAVLEEAFVKEYTEFLKVHGLYYTIEERDSFNGLTLETIAHRNRSTLPKGTINLMKFIADNKDENDNQLLTEFFDLLRSIDNKLNTVINFINAFSAIKLKIFE